MTVSDPARCTATGCDRPARLAVRTTRPSRDDLRTTIYYDDRTAPRTAQRYCRQHGGETLAALVITLTDADEEPAKTAEATP